jgi:hypothetical protein
MSIASSTLDFENEFVYKIWEQCLTTWRLRKTDLELIQPSYPVTKITMLKNYDDTVSSLNVL